MKAQKSSDQIAIDSADSSVPRGLRRWFVAHFLVDIAFAGPLFIAPIFILELFGWPAVDPFTARLVAAALFGIGIESLLARNSIKATFKGMLNLKIIWSTTAIAGMVASILQGTPAIGWVFVGIFAGFSAVWWYYRVTI